MRADACGAMFHDGERYEMDRLCAGAINDGSHEGRFVLMGERVWKTIEQVADSCVVCGYCARRQGECGQPNPTTFGEAARRLLDSRRLIESGGGGVDADLRDFSLRCFTCGRCTVRCPVGIRASRAVMAFRGAIMQSEPEAALPYRRYRCDLDDSMFNRMREVTGASYDDVLASTDSTTGDVCERTVFIPGCTLANNFPSLAQTTYDRLCEMGIVDCITSMCCGRPLSLSGLLDDAAKYASHLIARMREAGIVKIVTACPNCLYTFRDMLEQEDPDGSIDLTFVAQELVDAGVRFHPSEDVPLGRVSFHDPCPDRHDGIVAKSMRELFSEVEIVEPQNSMRDSVCCGSGGFAPVYAPESCQIALSARIGDFFSTRARCFISGCANCASAYKATGAVRAYHYLELILGAEMDMDLYNSALARLWDPSDELSLESFPVDRPIFTDGIGES